MGIKILEFDCIELAVIPDPDFGWLVTILDTERGDELEEDAHWITVRNSDGNPRAGIPHQLLIVAHSGIGRLCYFIHSARVKAFRGWAESIVVESHRPVITPQTLSLDPLVAKLIRLTFAGHPTCELGWRTSREAANLRKTVQRIPVRLFSEPRTALDEQGIS